MRWLRCLRCWLRLLWRCSRTTHTADWVHWRTAWRVCKLSHVDLPQRKDGKQ